MTPREIRKLRNRAKLTQKELGNILEVDHTTVSQWESGKNKPSETRKEMMRALKRELDQREEKEWRKFIARATGSLSLALFLRWMKGDE